LLIIRVNDTATIAGWANDQKILEFKICLRDKAIGWFESLIEDGIHLDDWDTVKAEFLESYKPKYSAKTTCVNFTYLTQKYDESINDYTYWVQMAYKHLIDNKPATMAAVRAVTLTVEEAKAKGISDAFKFVKHQLLLAGLKDGIRDKVLEAEKATFNESVKAARNLETVQNDHKRLHKIAAVKANLEEAGKIIWENLTEQRIEQVAVLHAHSNGFLPKKNNGPAQNNGQARNSTARNPNIICRYCNKKGQLQKECFSHQRNNASMADANFKVYESHHVNNVAYKSAGNTHQSKPISPFKVVSNSDPAPAQNCSPASINDAIQFLYTILTTDAVNEIKNNLKASFCCPYLWVSVQKVLRL
jgi:Retrotransposon gag protein